MGSLYIVYPIFKDGDSNHHHNTPRLITHNLNDVTTLFLNTLSEKHHTRGFYVTHHLVVYTYPSDRHNEGMYQLPTTSHVLDLTTKKIYKVAVSGYIDFNNIDYGYLDDLGRVELKDMGQEVKYDSQIIHW